MRRTMVLCLAFAVSSAFAQAIPVDRLVDWSGAGASVSPERSLLAIDADELRADPDGVLQNAINVAAFRTVILLPPGEYCCTTPIEMRSGITLRGQGAGRTVLRFTLSQSKVGAVTFKGRSVSSHPAHTSLKAATTHIALAEKGSTAFPGWLADVSMQNDPALMYTDPKWNVSWATRSRGQVTKITECTDDGLVLATPLRLDYPAEWSPEVAIYEPLTDAAVEKLTVEFVEGAGCYNILFDKARDCRVTDVESRNCAAAHVWVRRSLNIEVSQSDFAEAESYGGGGNGYGVTLAERSSSCLVVNNKFHRLRHAMMVKQGANGNVFAYNYSYGSTGLCDISLHGHYPYANLFEGNTADFVVVSDYWGPCGPLNTFFRNRLQGKGFRADDHSLRLNVIANTVYQGAIDVAPSCTEAFVAKNTVKGHFVGELLTDLPPSLFLAGKPAFWGDSPWPPTADGAIPAETR
mgnify:CR=1 FL=1|jgi:hypothetical protein